VSFLFINQSYEYDHKKYLTLFITTSFWTPFIFDLSTVYTN
jgi:hypothetical protein